MPQQSCKIGDVVQYRIGYGSVRTVRVIGRGTEMDCPVFDGELLDCTGEPTGRTVWGYDYQIIAGNPEDGEGYYEPACFD